MSEAVTPLARKYESLFLFTGSCEKYVNLYIQHQYMSVIKQGYLDKHNRDILRLRTLTDLPNNYVPKLIVLFNHFL